MAQQKPGTGRIVHYKLSGQDADAINRRRANATAHMQEHRERADGSQVHFGNPVREGDVFPAVVICVWSTSVNLQVFLDGNDAYWATSRAEGDESGTWHWPERV